MNADKIDFIAILARQLFVQSVAQQTEDDLDAGKLARECFSYAEEFYQVHDSFKNKH